MHMTRLIALSVYMSGFGRCPSDLCIKQTDHTQGNLSLGTRQHDRLCMLCMKNCIVNSTSCFQINRLSISKLIVECSTRFLCADNCVALLPATKLPRVWTALS